MPSWNDILSAPVFIINMDKSVERLALAKSRLIDAGFTNLYRFQAVDASKPHELAREWDKHGTKQKINYHRDPEFHKYIGKQGCFLSHANLWMHMIEQNIPYALVVEDDILFHPMWKNLAEHYYTQTPSDWELIYMGCQIEFNTSFHVDSGQVYCTHAMLLTNNGARKLYDTIVKNPPHGIYTIDNMIHDLQKENRLNVSYYVWNGRMYQSTVGSSMGKGWDRRNSGLVFQDDKLGSYIKEHY